MPYISTVGGRHEGSSNLCMQPNCTVYEEVNRCVLYLLVFCTLSSVCNLTLAIIASMLQAC